MRRHRTGLAAALASALVVVGACGGGEPDEPGGAVGAPSTPTSAVASELQARLDDLRAATGAPGVMALVRTPASEWWGSSGVAELPDTPLTESDRFRVGSISKPIVAFLVLDAVARGELSLDGTLAELLPGVVRDDPPTTLRMLLDHTSGIFNVGDEGDIATDIANLTDPVLRAEAEELGARYLAGEHVSMDAELFVALAETHDRYFEPGTASHYSNVNYQLAAMALERATGTPLAELLRTRLVDELDLQRTTIAPDDAGLPEVHGYHLADDGSFVDRTADFVALGNGGSGGVISTAGELLTMMEEIVSGGSLPPELAEDMRRPAAATQGTYGLGLSRYNLFCGTFYGHGGFTSGTHSLALVDEAATTGVIVVVNLQDDPEPDLLPTAEAMLCPTVG